MFKCLFGHTPVTITKTVLTKSHTDGGYTKQRNKLYAVTITTTKCKVCGKFKSEVK